MRAIGAGPAPPTRPATTASVFHHLWTGVLGPRGVPQVQIHGFADATAPEQVVVSTGAGPATPAARTDRRRDRRHRAGHDPQLGRHRRPGPARHAPTCRASRPTPTTGSGCTSSTTGPSATRPTLWQPAVDAVAAANPSLLAYDRPSPGGSGHVPKQIGAANTTGTSRYFAREDHRHRGATDVHTHAEPAVRFAPVDLPDQPTITADASRGDYFRVHLRGNRTLEAPTDGADGQRLFIEALASGGQRDLTLGGSITLSVGVPTTVTIAAGKRWFGEMVNVGGLGWVVILSATQA